MQTIAIIAIYDKTYLCNVDQNEMNLNIFQPFPKDSPIGTKSVSKFLSDFGHLLKLRHIIYQSIDFNELSLNLFPIFLPRPK